MKNQNKLKHAIICIVLLLIPVLIILLSSTFRNINNLTKMYIENARLTIQEENIVKLLGMDTGQKIFDFQLDDTVQSIQINIYELNNDSWRLVSSETQSFKDSKGRLSLTFEKLAEGLRVALQSERSNGSNKYTTETIEELDGMSIATTMLTDKTEVFYDIEIPLVVQIMTAQHDITTYILENFNKLEDYIKHGYEYVHAVTIIYSQKSVSELSDDNQH